MPSRRYHGKERGSSDFIHVDLLPEMKRPRQFNVNIVFIVLATVVLTWLIIYIPLSSRQDTLDEVLEQNSELTNERTALRTIIDQYRLDAERVEVADNIDSVRNLQSDHIQYKSDFEDAIAFVDPNGRMDDFRYNAVTGEVTFRVVLRVASEFHNPFRDLRLELESLPYVEHVSPAAPTPVDPGSTREVGRFTVEVDRDVE